MRLVKPLSMFLGLWLISLAHAIDSDTASREYQLKTAYLFHFAELTEWPAALPVTICLLGNSPLRTYLPALEGQRINNQAVHVQLDDHAGIDNCQILFLSDNAALSRQVRETAKNRHILLVGDSDNFAAHGGMVQFTLRNNKLKLAVNLPAVKDAGLKLSSKLLRMADILE